MKLGNADQSGQVGDSHSSSTELPSRSLLSSSPCRPSSSISAIARLDASSTWHHARQAGAAPGARVVANTRDAIGSPSSNTADATGRAGAEEPPHQTWKAPTVTRSAPNTTATSNARRRASPPAQSISASPAMDRARTGRARTRRILDRRASRGRRASNTPAPCSAACRAAPTVRTCPSSGERTRTTPR